jgi:putative ABC transport system permease protein
MTTPLAWHNLLHNRVRTSVAVMGVTFAVVLMFMQLGFLEAVKASATMIYDVLDFDICIRSRDYDYFSDARTIPKIRLAQAEGVPGVATATPLWVGVFSWRNPYTGEPRAILALGVTHAQSVFRDAEIQRAADDALLRPGNILIDTKTRREFGPHDGIGFGPADHGQHVEVNGKEFLITGHFTRGAGLTAGGAVLMSPDDFLECAPQMPSDQASLGLIRVAPDHDVNQAVENLRAALPADVEIITRDDLLRTELQHWVWETNYGLIFQSGVLVAVIVGTAIVYQVLASDVSSLLPEYATLKAMGYGNRHLVSVLVQQSLLLALLAFVAGLGISQVLYGITAAGAQIPIRMTSFNLALVFGLSIAMCVISGIAAVRKAFQADPADLF